MRGNNVLSLCEAQMITIVQEWIDRNIATKPKVTCVTRSSSGGASRDMFEVSLTDPPVRPGTAGPGISDMTGSTGI